MCGQARSCTENSLALHRQTILPQVDRTCNSGPAATGGPGEQGYAVFDHVVILGRDEIPVDGASEDGLEVGIGFGVAGFGAVEPLFVDGFQPGQELEAQQVAKCKRDRTLPMTIDILPVDFHGGAMA